MKLSSIDTITTKLLMLVLFITVIPMIVILNFSTGIINESMLGKVQEEISLATGFAKLELQNRFEKTSAVVSKAEAKSVCDLISQISGKDIEIYFINNGKPEFLASNLNTIIKKSSLDKKVMDNTSPRLSAFFTDNFAGSYKIGQYSQVEDKKNKTTYLIYISTNEKSFFEPAVKNTVSITFISLISLITAIILAAFFARTITNPVLKLVSAARSISKGDLTQRVKIKGNDEIARLSENFNKMAEGLQREEELKDNFIAALTHDMKVPLIAENKTLDYFIQSLYGPLSTEQKEVLELIKESNLSLLKMVNNILEVYKYDIGSVSLELSDFSISALLCKVSRELTTLCEDKNISLSATSSPDEIFIHADEIEIKRVLTNLIANAVSNTENRGSITCKLKLFDDGAEVYLPAGREHENTTLQTPVELSNKILISIDDTGKGLSESDIKEMFKKFALNKGRKPVGTGLGLYYSYQVVAKHNGVIWVESTLNKGSSFKFVLPVNL